MKKNLLLLSILSSLLNANAQNPFEKLGYTPKIATYSQGQFDEFHDQDTLVQIGSILFNINTRQIVAFVQTDTVHSEATLQPDVVSRWMSPDPLGDKMAFVSPYCFSVNSPILLMDPDGQEPIKPLVGSVSTFIEVLNNTPSKIGGKTGLEAAQAMLRLGSTEWDNKQMRPLPTTTPYFNNREGRYIYTEKGGWVDMVHFLFYAGKAYEYKRQKLIAQSLLKDKTLSLQERAHAERRASIDPVNEAVQDGYAQEMTDRFAAPYSAYSYEDLPSDKYGADFATNYFDPTSKLNFGEQLTNYLNEKLGATDPQNAPNYENLPSIEPTDKPTRTNHATTPVYTNKP